jgi:hypothetical protein
MHINPEAQITNCDIVLSTSTAQHQALCTAESQKFATLGCVWLMDATGDVGMNVTTFNAMPDSNRVPTDRLDARRN